MHGKLVACRDARNQHFIGGIFTCRGCIRRHCGGGRSRPNKRLKHVDFPESRPARPIGQGKKGSRIYFSPPPGTQRLPTDYGWFFPQCKINDCPLELDSLKTAGPQAS
jgi:hypothetical protein